MKVSLVQGWRYRGVPLYVSHNVYIYISEQKDWGGKCQECIISLSYSLSEPVSGGQSSSSAQTAAGEPVPIRAPASLWRCSRIMHLLRDLHPTLLSALEGIVDQVGGWGVPPNEDTLNRTLFFPKCHILEMKT